MPSIFTWIIRDHLGPIRSARHAEYIGRSLAPSILIGYHVAVPLDGHGMFDRFIVFAGTSGWNALLGTTTTPDRMWPANGAPRSVLLYSRRSHDIIEEHDESAVHFVASWLASERIGLLDWFVMTRRTARSIPADFEIGRGW